MEHGLKNIRAIERRAEARARRSPSGIGAAIAERLGKDDHGRERVRIRLSDGRYFGWLEVTVGPDDPRGEALEAAVERHAGKLPAHRRLEALEASSPFVHFAG